MPSPERVWAVEQTAASATFPLRLEILGRGSAAHDLARPDDDHPTSGHFVVRVGSEVAGTGTVRQRVVPLPSPWPGWQIRGMAVREDLRGRGIGGAILDAVIDHVRSHGGGLLWCHARVAAASLYLRAGFQAQGPEVDDPVAGRQVLMSRLV